MSVNFLTKQQAYDKAQPPTAETTWPKYLGPVNVRNTWKITSVYTTPRDEVTWMKVWHRNLYLAGYDPTLDDNSCRVWGCNCKENITHLVECPTITRHFWRKVVGFMDRFEMRSSGNKNSYY